MTESTLARAMTDARARLFPESAKLIPVLQVNGVLHSQDIERSLEDARKETLRWIQNRSVRLPSNAWKFESFELEYGGTGAISLRDEDTDYWVARLVDPDKNIAGRIWTTETSIVKSSNTVHFAVKQIVQTREAEPEFLPGIPSILRKIATSHSLEIDNRRFSETAWKLDREAEIDELFSLIYSQTRQLPIYVVTLDDNENSLNNAAINANDLTKRCIGLAHVAVVPAALTYFLTDQLGKPFSVFRKAVRTYFPKFDPYTDSPYDHPLAMPIRIENWGERGAADFVDFLVKRAAWRSHRYQNRNDLLPSFTQVREASGRQRLQESVDAGEDTEKQLKLAHSEINNLRQDRDEWEALATSEEMARQGEQKRNNVLESDLFRLRHRIVEIEELLETRTGEKLGVEIPESYDEIKEWAEQYLGDRVVLSGRAIRATKSSQFEDISLSYQALLMMANEYWRMKTMGGQNKILIFEEKLKKLGLENTRTGERTRLLQKGDEFQVSWRGSKKLLEWHLKNNDSRNPKKVFRLYYFWDDETQQTVVGSLPLHLRTRLT